MKVRFIVDYRGILTDEKFYRRGEVDDFPPAVARKLTDQGRAVEVAVRKRAKK